MKKPENGIVGIYKITNPKGKVYIGQSVNITRRKNTYKNFKSPSQPKIYNSIKKYSWENHIFEIIEECTLEQLSERETYWKQYYLDKNDGDWDMVLFCNLHDNGTGPLTDETKRKIGDANRGRKYSEEACQKISVKLKGRKYSEETLKKLSQPRSEQAKKNMKYPKSQEHADNIKKGKQNNPTVYSQESRNKIKDSNLKHYENGSERNKKLSISQSKPVIQYDKNMIFIKEWGGIKEACLAINGNSNDSGIGQVCNGKRKTAYGFIWRFKN